jgi:hypothetical protein
VADICIHAPENNINGCELVLEKAHYHMVLVSQQYGRRYIVNLQNTAYQNFCKGTGHFIVVVMFVLVCHK